MGGKRQQGKISKTRIWGQNEHVWLKLRMGEICAAIYFRFQHFYSSTFVLFLFSRFFLTAFFYHTKDPGDGDLSKTAAVNRFVKLLHSSLQCMMLAKGSDSSLTRKMNRNIDFEQLSETGIEKSCSRRTQLFTHVFNSLLFAWKYPNQVFPLQLYIQSFNMSITILN